MQQCRECEGRSTIVAEFHPELKRIITESKQRIAELEALKKSAANVHGLSSSNDEAVIDERIEVQRAVLGAAQTKLERLESRIER